MESQIFPLLKLPEFKTIQLNHKKFISSQILYSSPRSLFLKVVSNMRRDENYKKFYISRSPYTQFVKEFCKTKKVPNLLKHVKVEWNNLDDQGKEMFRGPEALTETKAKTVKMNKKCRPARCSYSIYVELKCKEKSRSYQELGKKWKSSLDVKKEPFKILHLLDQERFLFENSVFSRFELVLRLFGACAGKKLFKRNTGFSVFKDELKDSLVERGFTKVNNLTQIGRKRYSKLEKDERIRYKDIAKVKNQEIIDTLFERVMKKANLDYRDFCLQNNASVKDLNNFEEDFDAFIGIEDQFNF
jgi:hypothetical protein